jgi:hypothetical protein
MKQLLLAAAAAATLTVAAVPASAQFYAGADPGGVGVQVGPFGVGVGPAYGWHDHMILTGAAIAMPMREGDRYAYAGDCRVIQERTITPNRRAIYTTRRVCD